MTSTVLVRLEGPLQSWGTTSRFTNRDTQTEPSKSGVLGLVGAALGMARDDGELIERLARSSFAVRIDREGRVRRDFHTAGGGMFRGQKHSVDGQKHPVVSERFYLTDASFLAALQFDDVELARHVDAALGNPRWPLFLGRRACPPSLPTRAGFVTEPVEVALRAAPWPSHTRPSESVRLVVDCMPTHVDAQPRQDQPLSFRLNDRHYARRFVRTCWIEPSELALPPENAPCLSIVGISSART